MSGLIMEVDEAETTPLFFSDDGRPHPHSSGTMMNGPWQWGGASEGAPGPVSNASGCNVSFPMHTSDVYGPGPNLASVLPAGNIGAAGAQGTSASRHNPANYAPQGPMSGTCSNNDLEAIYMQGTSASLHNSTNYVPLWSEVQPPRGLDHQDISMDHRERTLGPLSSHHSKVHVTEQGATAPESILEAREQDLKRREQEYLKRQQQLAKEMEDWGKRKEGESASLRERDRRLTARELRLAEHQVGRGNRTEPRRTNPPRKMKKCREYVFRNSDGYAPDVDEAGKNRTVEEARKKHQKHKSREENDDVKAIRGAFLSFFPRFKYTQQFDEHTPADRRDVEAYETSRNQNRGPNPDDLKIDAHSEHSSRWNKEIVNIVYKRLLVRESKAELPPEVERDVRERIYGLIQRAKLRCRKGIPRIIDAEVGVVEDPVAVKNRRKEETKEEDRALRHYQRRSTLFHSRLDTCERKVGKGLMWDFLLRLVETLGIGGMSSDDTEDEGGYTIKVLPWRKDIRKHLNYIDDRRQDVVSGRGSQPRKRGLGTRSSKRNAARKLPRILYNEAWLAIREHDQLDILESIPKQLFRWMEIHDVQDPE